MPLSQFIVGVLYLTWPSIRPSVCLSVPPSLLFACLFLRMYMSICRSVFLSSVNLSDFNQSLVVVCLSVCLSVRHFHCLQVCFSHLSVSMSVHLSIILSVRPSVCLPVIYVFAFRFYKKYSIFLSVRLLATKLFPRKTIAPVILLDEIKYTSHF